MGLPRQASSPGQMRKDPSRGLKTEALSNRPSVGIRRLCQVAGQTFHEPGGTRGPATLTALDKPGMGAPSANPGGDALGRAVAERPAWEWAEGGHEGGAGGGPDAGGNLWGAGRGRAPPPAGQNPPGVPVTAGPGLEKVSAWREDWTWGLGSSGGGGGGVSRSRPQRALGKGQTRETSSVL